MRDFWTFVGGVAVGILAVTGVYALEDEKSDPVEHDAGTVGEMETLEAQESEVEDDLDDDEKLIVRAS